MRMPAIGQLRQRIEDHIRQQRWAVAHQWMAELWRQNPKFTDAGYILNSYEGLRNHMPLVEFRLAILRSFTVEPLLTFLQAGAFVGGIDLAIHVGDFNAYAQEILDQESNLYRFVPDATILAVQGRDLMPELFGHYADLSPSDLRAVINRITESFQNYVETLRLRSDSHLIIHSFEEPQTQSMGDLDRRINPGQIAAIREINQALYSFSERFPGVYILDYNALIARCGGGSWFDKRNWMIMQMPIANDKLICLVKEWLRFIHPMSGRVCKALITDLDNTIWGGVIGEDGLQGIQCGSDYSGSYYQSIQRAILELHGRGILLAICSKNNEADALEALEKHRDVLLRPHFFSAMRINWQDKVQNIREIAAELNIGTDSFAYIDDNPVELELVRTELPEMCVIELPASTEGLAEALHENPFFEPSALSAEDKRRQHYYTEQHQRSELEQSTSSLEDFYRSLEQAVDIEMVSPETVERVAQLISKTNQFNLTTRRYKKQQIINMTADPEWQVFTVRVRDRFGDSGLVGVAITHDMNGICEVDTFLLSCRVIGRTVETALLYFLVDRARSLRLKQLQGAFLPTKKNAVARDFYSRHHFQLLEERGDGTLWGIDPGTARIVCPEWIQLKISEGAQADG